LKQTSTTILGLFIYDSSSKVIGLYKSKK
jgi:hypothetical protein